MVDDIVFAHDPETGLADAREVLATWPHTDTLDELIRNGLDWPEGQIHNGNHAGSYYDGLANILADLPPNPSIQDVVDTLNRVSLDITEGRLFPAGS